MAIDVNVFDKLKSYDDYARAEEEFQQKKQAAQLEAHAKQLGLLGQIVGNNSVDQGTYDHARAYAQKNGIDTSVLPNEFNPDVVNRLRFAGATPTAQLSAMLQQQQMALRAGTATGDVTGFGYGGMGGTPPQPASSTPANPQVNVMPQPSDNNFDALFTPQPDDVQAAADAKYGAPKIGVPAKQPNQTVAGYKTAIETNPAAQAELSNAKASGAETGKSQAEEQNRLSDAEASLPQLEYTTQRLSDLGKKATYTYAGQARDAVVRQAGMVTEGMKARADYEATVRNVLLPQLRQTFGAQFTAREGEQLIGTLGDPNKSPEEKDAILSTFIDQKKQTIQSLRRRVGQQPSQSSTGVKFLGFE